MRRAEQQRRPNPRLLLTAARSASPGGAAGARFRGPPAPPGGSAAAAEAQGVRQRAEGLMTSSLQYSLIVVIGAVSGLTAHKLSALIRGPIKTRLFLKYLFEGVALIPAIALILYFFEQRGSSTSLLDMIGLQTAFLFPYAVVRIIGHCANRSRSADTEDALPFSHWIELLGANEDAANRFLGSYLLEVQQRRGDAAAHLKAGLDWIQRVHAKDPRLPGAVDRLRFELARIEIAAGQLQHPKTRP